MTPSDPPPGSGEVPEVVSASFEEAMAELEQLVASLEEGELDLESSIASFERGMVLLRHLGATLDRAESRMKVLLEADGGLIERLVESTDDEDEP